MLFTAPDPLCGWVAPQLEGRTVRLLHRVVVHHGASFARGRVTVAWLLAVTVWIPRSATCQRVDSVRVHAVALGIVQADNQRSLERVLSYYAPDAVLLPPGSAPVQGLARIRPRYEALFRDYDPAIELHIVEEVVVGDLAYVRGVNAGQLQGRNGVPAGH